MVMFVSRYHIQGYTLFSLTNQSALLCVYRCSVFNCMLGLLYANALNSLTDKYITVEG